jgi:hypothetical protein
MGFAWEPANVRGSAITDAWDCAPPRPRHRGPGHWHVPGPAACAHATMTAIAAGSRRARTLLATRPALADHRRAF